MLSREGFEDLVRRSWDGDGAEQGNTMDRITQCRRKKMAWKKQANLNSRDKILRLCTAFDKEKLQELFVDEDIPLILQIRFNTTKHDEVRWGFSRNGIYNSRSGYKLAESISTMNHAQQSSLPHLEKQLWKDLWKTKTLSKLRHFLWRILSGALAVKQQLRSRGIPTDSTCLSCHLGPETICHMLFHCPSSKEVWERSSFILPPAGFSTSSVFLNMHYLMAFSKKNTLDPKTRLSFPWMLWQIWEARNLFCFEHRSFDAEMIVHKAMEEASIWLQLHSFVTPDAPPITVEEKPWNFWKKPPPEIHPGKLCSIAGGLLQEYDLNTRIQNNFYQASIPWNLHPLWKRLRRALDKIETSRMMRITEESNKIAQAIAESALQMQWQQSYSARNGPDWLNSRIRMEAFEVEENPLSLFDYLGAA
ncbi:hypothetical protein F2Q68_00001170 [Brassica cretica]|uniref:Reverse transcriptase zinc-binding domain-containing protein n=1 Tax=Brassica cretica TaxID=69181 RepID=A0A8S9JE40_BRACR|nr:hypothetical protein F2Q68_00001170 [Brassica cretica]